MEGDRDTRVSYLSVSAAVATVLEETLALSGTVTCGCLGDESSGEEEDGGGEELHGGGCWLGGLFGGCVVG